MVELELSHQRTDRMKALAHVLALPVFMVATVSCRKVLLAPSMIATTGLMIMMTIWEYVPTANATVVWEYSIFMVRNARSGNGDQMQIIRERTALQAPTSRFKEGHPCGIQ